MHSPTFGSLFAGVGGFDLGMETAGWECGWQVEWDKHCQQVLARHWPDVPRWADVRDVNGTELPPVDCITFGSPCQDLSVAGKRAGLDGERSGLFYEAIRIIKEMRHATDGTFPRWAIWENVAGALSSNKGDDFAAVLDTLADTGALVLEWAILDARWFGVPQRRRRVFVIACFDPATAAQCPDPLLPVAPRSSWNPPSSNTPRQDIAGTLGGGSGSRGWAPDTDRMTFVPVTAGTLSPGAHPGSYNGQDAYNDLLIPEAIPIQDGREIEKRQNGLGVGVQGDPSYTLDTTGGQAVAVPYVKVIRSGARDADGNLPPEVWREEHTAPTLKSIDNTSEARATVLAFDPGVVGPLTSTGMSRARGTESVESHHVLAFDSTYSNQSRVDADLSPTIKVRSGLGIPSPPAVLDPPAAVRRLTPLECERLMGWPDDHTRYRADGTEQSDSARYKQCGNGVASPVAAWIANHLRKATNA